MVNVPGTERPFRLADYKKEIGKVYSRITFFIHPERHFKGGLWILLFKAFTCVYSGIHDDVFVFSAPTTVDDGSDSDSEVVITSRSTAELNRADTLVC